MRNGSMRAIPQSLPPGLYEAASRQAVTTPRSSQVQRQYTGSQRPQSPLSRPFGASPFGPEVPEKDWLISNEEKIRFDQNFAELDRSGQGILTGDQAAPFFSKSGLSEETLASIWDLADINSEGQLNRDEFAVAMYLIRQQRARRDGRGDLPPSLPAKLVPPSMRKDPVQPAQSTAPNFDTVAPSTQQSKSAADDLFGLDALATGPQQTTTTRNDPFGNDQASSTAPSSPRGVPPVPAARNQGTSFKPFIPTSSFGQGLTHQSTGESFQSDNSSSRAAPKQTSASDDLLGDNDPDVSSKFTQETTDVSNMSNQSNILNNQLYEVQTKKATAERDLSSSSNQKKELESKLAQARSQYEQELRDVKLLEEQLKASRNDTKKLGQELAMIEGTHQDLQTQHKQVATALEADQRENASLKDKIKQLNSELNLLRPQVEKMKNDAHQQRGMTAINKKQLATSESEREKLSGERETMGKSLSERPPSERSIHTEARSRGNSGVASPSSLYSPGVGGAAAGPSRNPFFRQATQQSIDRNMSPSSTAQGSRAPSGSFDNVFGPGPSQLTSPEGPAPVDFQNNSQAGANPDLARTLTPSATHSPPATVETPESAEIAPPPPPESRQITSSALPFRTNMLRSDSVGSSVKANPPASRSGFSDKPTSTQSATSSVDGESPVANDPQSSTPTSKGRPTKATQGLEPSHSSSIPGAFPGETESPMRSTPTGGSITSEASKDPATFSGTAREQFDAPTESSRIATRPRSDFDSAFADIGPSKEADQEDTTFENARPLQGLANGSAAKTNPEFPPIQDVQQDDSDSESEQGFGDHFAHAPTFKEAAGASQGTAQHEGEAQSAASTGAGSLPVPRNLPNEVASSAPSSGLPTPSEQKSPPTYDQTVPERSGDGSSSNQSQRQYGDLLPSREVADASPEVVASPSESRSTSLAHVPTSMGHSNSQSQPISGELKDVGRSEVSNHDDFDSAFNDLSDAQEADEGGQDPFSVGFNRKDDHEFNPTFDSPTQSRSIDTQRAPSGGSFGAMGRPPSLSKQPKQPEAGLHDWDEIFSGLDKPSTAQNGGKDPFALGAPSQSLQAPAGRSTQSGRPQTLARAISTGTEHDDPILKTLTSMGYARDEALNALEKYDYNLDKASAPRSEKLENVERV